MTTQTTFQIEALTVGLFNMAIGGYADNFTGYFNKVQADWHLNTDDAMSELARALVRSPDFQKSFQAVGTDVTAQAKFVLKNFALDTNQVAIDATVNAIKNFNPNNFDGELASMIWGYSKGLITDTAVKSQFADAAELMRQKVLVSDTTTSIAHDATQKYNDSTNVSDLQQLMSWVSGDKVGNAAYQVDNTFHKYDQPPAL